MGQQQTLQKALKSLASDKFYELDIRLLQKVENYASSFPADLQDVIKEVQQFYVKQPEHFLAEFLISEINDRFNSMSINKEALENVSNSKTILEIFQINPTFLAHKFWTELQTMQKFLKYLERVEEKYWIEQKLHDVLERGNNTSKNTSDRTKLLAKSSTQNLPIPFPGQSPKSKQSNQQPTIRQPIKPYSSNLSYKTELHQQLFKKVFFYFYQQLMRAFCGSKNGIERANAIEYHVTIGRNILKIVSADFISEEKLFELLFYMVKIEKTEKSLAQLQEVSAEYEIYCLKHEHNISVNKQKLEKIKLFTRCYLDELYFLAIKEAEDPQIVEDTGGSDSGLMLKIFPINRVKQKNRNM